MDETMIALNRIAATMTPRATACPCRGRACGGACQCRCAGCRHARSKSRGWPEAARRRRKPSPPRAPGPPARGGTTRRAARGPELRSWQGWSQPVTLAQIQQAQVQARAGRRVADPVMRRMLAGGGQVYRITRAGVDRDRALTIGATLRTGTIADRVTQHHTSRAAGDRKVWQAIHGLPADQIYVQAGLIGARDRHNRRTKLFENWLQVRERPLLYSRDTTTFDEAALPRRRHDCGCGCSG